ncbi:MULTISPECIES: DUF4340 domain-containing protein [unclassified Coleofasciculus]|uniref:DUF4340 domain-containing protein n=1 Tax=unclassified Coleofasciculus TaxID=2692782 RepID=UPI00187FC741|nr:MULTISPECIES: DUF4340 domain-containing protein [unclassified Coleofasciculus]MBE9128440.1 DUF4340 domain-containing protein [Coleofasciculus sp. LEGE 07081]MBE9149403.1 DUF4340 domain-containing protein [Coleofasciculus sp. LEGE 07092]
MKLQRTTLILLVLAVFLGGFVYFYEVQGAPKREAAKETKKPIFSFEEDQIQGVTIYLNKDQRKKIFKFERVGKEKMPWQMKYPKDVSASDASVAFLLDLLVEGKSDRSFTVPATQLKEYGLDKPQATVKVELKNREIHRINLGKPDFNRSFLYAQIDPRTQDSGQVDVLLVPVDFEYAVNRPVSEWEQSTEEEPERFQEPEAEQTPSPTEDKETPATEGKPSPTEDKEQPATEAKPSPTEKKETPATEEKPSPTEENE